MINMLYMNCVMKNNLTIFISAFLPRDEFTEVTSCNEILSEIKS